MNNPVGIDWEPYFSWVMSSDRQNVMQNTYQIIVSDERGKVFWDSGKTESEESSFIKYKGEQLESRMIYRVFVRVWDNYGECAEKTVCFETAFMKKSDWKAKWVKSDFPVIERNAHLGEQPQNVYFRRKFKLNKKPEKARVYASCHGCYQIFINGIRPDDRELAPECTVYREYLNYQTYDVTSLLREGENVLGMLVGDGWYHGFMTKDPSDSYDPSYAVIFQLEAKYENGSGETVISDSETETALSPVLCSDLFAGERYDANLEIEGWNMPDCAAEGEKDESGACKTAANSVWIRAQVADWNMDNLKAQYGAPVRPVMTLPVKEVLTSPKGEKILDFGQVIAGRIRMKVREPKKTKVVITCTEGLDENGNFFDNNPTADQRIEYISCGKERMYEPHFTFQGFRYIMVSGVAELRAEDYTAVVLSSEKENSGTFICSDPELNRLYENTRWSQRANMISIPTDCPQREKAGWLGDIQVYTRTALLNEDITPFLTSWLRNMAIEQKPSGALPMVVPLAGAYIGQYEMMKQQAGTEGDISPAGWGDAAVLVPWYMYEITGNTIILEQQYDIMRKWCDYVIREAHDKRNPESTLPDEIEQYLWNTGYHYGEHLIPSYSKDGYGEATFEAIRQSTKYVAPIYSYYSVSTFAKISCILGEREEDQETKEKYFRSAEKYEKVAEKIKWAISNGVIGKFGEMPADLMGAYAMPLYFDLVPEHLKSHFEKKLIEHIRKNNSCLDTGFLGTPVLLDTLCRIGRSDLAYDILLQKHAPSWLYEVEHGATTIWESWFAMDEEGKPYISHMGDYTFTMSLNHYAFGCVDDWMFRNINGIDSVKPGYKKIRIQPRIDRRISCAERSFLSEYGIIVSKWKKEKDGHFYMHVEIPCNTRAEIVLPDGTKTETGSGCYNYECMINGKINI